MILLTKRALAFKSAKQWKDALASHEKASDAYQRADQLFMSAKSLESQSQIYSQHLNLPAKGADVLERASQMYRLHASPDKAGEALERAGRLLEVSDPHKAVVLMVQAGELLDDEDRGRFATEAFRKAAVLSLKNGKVQETIPIQDRLIGVWRKVGNKPSMAKAELSMIILLLKSGIAPQDKLFEYVSQDAFTLTDEGKIASDLISAVEGGDEEALQAALASPAVEYLDNEFVRLAKTLKVQTKTASPIVVVGVGSAEKEKELEEIAQQVEEDGIC
jgi:hypothetical protein